MRGDIVRTAWVLAAAVLLPLGLEIFVGLTRVGEHGAAAVAAYLAMGGALAVALAALAAALAPAVAAGVRLWARLVLPVARYRAWPGLFARPAVRGGGAAWVHAAATAGALFVVGTAAIAGVFAARFREPRLTGLVTALAALAVLALASTAGAIVLALLRRAPRLLPERLAARDPLRDARAAAVAWGAALWLAIGAALAAWDSFAVVFPVRLAAALSLAGLVVLEGGAVVAALFDGHGRPGRRLRRAAALAVPAAIVVLGAVGDGRARAALLDAAPLAAGYRLLAALSDVDRDGASALLGGGDCAPFDAAIHPDARDVPDDGIDQNCSGRDHHAGPPRRTAPAAPLPAALRRPDYDLLLVSIDTLRYDHTTPAGYARDTTPRLAALAARAAWCEEAHAAGNLTAASLPVLAAGRHLVELPLGDAVIDASFAPRVLLPDATTLAEVLQGAGFRTSMFTGHYLFEGWQLAQGMEHAVNMPGGDRDGGSPRIVAAAIAHLGRLASGRRWFAWVHLLDPHQPYQRHPGFVDFGPRPADRYDDDVAYADHQLGVLLDWVAADAARAARTVVVVTADHGEHLGEAGRSFHGNSLDATLTHVPLAIYVPGMVPRRVKTPISLVDLAPILTAVLGVAPSPDWTGEARLAALFEGVEEVDRVVFAADDAHDRVVAITPGYRLHLDARDTLYRLVEPARDPAERADVSEAQPAVRRRLEAALTAWREGLTPEN